MKEFDYIIIGGGCAGLSLAYELNINKKLEKKTLAIIEIREKYKIKSLVLVDYLKSKKKFITIRDHVNKTGYNFLRSKTPFKKRETFPDMSKVYLSKNGEVVFSVGSSFRDDLDINHNYTSWIGGIATVWKYIGVDIYGFAYAKEFKFDSVSFVTDPFSSSRTQSSTPVSVVFVRAILF